ncbi:hypothetical protein K1X22_05640 [Mycolicibacterium farcinogenes]|uniref:hypothetical protein n=1 Tax=Mycolicibacterium farcinogenes TaxID=1802 RepID=UPI001C8E423C|nr:hypothetical protein [Mycolicibacterium farcinogenes]QZH61244.1 hypothetical protein K1X22_05640 [Mycolicibacterium farcinogenes]
MTSNEKDAPFSPRWLAAQIGAAEALRRRHELHAEATGRKPADEFRAGLEGLGPAELRKALSARFKEHQGRQDTRTDEEKEQAMQRLRDTLAEGADLGRAVYDAVNPPEEQHDSK